MIELFLEVRIVYQVAWYYNTYNSFYTKDRKSTRLNSSHSQISYAVFCLKKKKNNRSDASIQDVSNTRTEPYDFINCFKEHYINLNHTTIARLSHYCVDPDSTHWSH